MNIYHLNEWFGREGCNFVFCDVNKTFSNGGTFFPCWNDRGDSQWKPRTHRDANVLANLRTQWAGRSRVRQWLRSFLVAQQPANIAHAQSFIARADNWLVAIGNYTVKHYWIRYHYLFLCLDTVCLAEWSFGETCFTARLVSFEKWIFFLKSIAC